MAKKVLIVEDDPAMLAILAERIAQEGFAVLQAQDGQQGLSIALREVPDLILLDLLMPKVSGTDMLSQLRKDSRGARVPVIILSNLNENDAASKTAQLKATSYIVKSNTSLAAIVGEVKKMLSVEE